MIRKLIIYSVFSALAMLNTNAFAQESEENSFSMNTTAFLNEGMLPVLYTCDGKDLSPQLSWSNPPEKAKYFAIVVSDPEAANGTFYHWVVFNIPKNTTELAQGTTKFPAGTIVSQNSFSKNQYNGPCPPHDTTHTYKITLYGLNDKLNLKSSDKPEEVVKSIEKFSVGQTELTMVYSRWFGSPE